MFKKKLSVAKIREYIENVSIDCWVVCVYLVCLPFTIVTTPFGSLLKVISMPIIAVLLCKLLFGRCKLIRFNSVHLFYTLYMLYSIGGLLLLSEDTTVTVTKDMFLAYATVMLITMRVYNENERRLMETAWLFMGLLCVCLGIFSTEDLKNTGRMVIVIGGNIEDPNQFCAYLIVPILLCLKRILKKTPMFPAYALLLLLMLYVIMRGGSRGGMIAVMISVGIYAILGIRDIRKKIAIVAAGLMCIVVAVTVILPMLPEEVQQRYSLESIEEDGGAGRFEIWSYLLQYTAEKPERIIRGEGIMSTIDAVANSNLGIKVDGAHNQYVQVFADQGVVGLAVFLAWLAACFFRNIRKGSEYACAMVGLAALLMSLSMYTFKPMANIVIMCAMTFDNNCYLSEKNELKEQNI